MSMQQLMLWITQQKQMYQTQMQTQFQMQMQQANSRFEYLLASQGERRKKDPPTYEGKFGEDLELWIFATEEYYANKRGVMEADTSDFVTMISSSLGKSVLNWYRVFSPDCETAGTPKTWQLFKTKLRERFRPKDFEYSLRERLFQLKQHGTIHEYVSSFQDLMSQSELEISEMEKRFYFQNGLRAETAKKSLRFATNFEFAHYGGQSAKASMGTASTSKPSITSKPPSNYPKRSVDRKPLTKSGSKDDWKKSATCHNCGQLGHIKPQCKVTKESNRYVGGSFYAILEVKALACRHNESPTSLSIFVDNGSSLNGVTEELAKQLQLDIKEHPDELMVIQLGYNQTVQRPKRTVEMRLQIPDFLETCETFTVMPVPEGKDVMLGMKWLRENNPDNDWEQLLLRPRTKATEPPLQLIVKNRPPARATWPHGCIRRDQNHFIQVIPERTPQREGVEAVFVVNPHNSEKAERFKQQGWEALVDNPAYEVLLKYRDTVFRTELLNSTPPVRDGIEHEIQLQPGPQPITVKQWRQSPEQRKVIQDWTKEMVQAGIIRPSTSAFSAPTFCVKKPVGWRIVHDYRQLNNSTILPAIPMPRKEDTFDAMGGSYWFSCMDLLWGYHQVKLRESDIPFTAFSTPDGLFEQLVTPMGLSGSPGTFNRLIQRVFRDLRDVMRIYFDDIYVYTQDHDVRKHVEALDRVLKRCQEQQLYVKLSKCQFCVDEIPCLGDFVGRNGVRMDPDKVKIIREWPIPRTKKQMESLLGTTVYVSRFCADFAQFARPLHESTKSLRPKETLHLSDHQIECFNELKRRLSTPPVLQLPDFDKPFGIRMDASNFAIEGVLFQNEGGVEHPIAFTGRKMKPAELNYPVREQELLAIMHALRVWRVYLLDNPFTVETDHKSIETILTQKTTNRRLAHWFNELAEFQPKFKWIPGDSNQVSDAASRNPLFEHKAAQVSLSELIEAARNREVVASIQTTSATVTHSAKQLYSTDRQIREIVQSIDSGKEVPRYSVTNGVLYCQTGDGVKPRLVIPDNEDMKNRVICENHDVVAAGHPGYFKTYLGVQEKYYWPKMSKYIQRYVNTCELCQRNKARQTKPPGLLQPLEIPEGRWIDISMDFMTSLPRTEAGKDAIMVIVDRLTKRAKFIARKTSATAEETATLFMVNYVKDHGVPKSIVSDRDSKFTSKFWQEVITTLETTHKLSSAFRPQTDGQTDRTNRFVEDYLRGVVNPAQNDWEEYLHLAEFAYNRRVHSSIGPFEADLGYVPYIPDDVARDPEFEHLNKSAQDFILKQDTLLKIAQDAMSEAQTRMKSYYVQDFSVGYLVLLDGRNLDIRHKGFAQAKKLAPRFIGPYPIVKQVHRDSYELQLSKGLKLHPVFHTSLLKPYHNDKSRPQKVSKVLLTDGTEGQLVHKVIGHRRVKKRLQYKIWWLGETREDATWEPVENLNQIPGLIDQ
ncbi:polyprotein [Phytophthora palmivora]|uniref:RNA-directed DNA polymerase n=1 Tax=Phytophthora palmivora TaxID=4796 RepID=A0A2P4X854_9STRA|nr:polyprotein [Phytophthora palmivora]